MKLNIKTNEHTTPSEYIALAAFFTAVSQQFAVTTMPFSPPEDAAELNEPEGPVVVTTQHGAVLAGGPEAPKRRRRSKAEIEAAAAAEPGTTVATTTTDPEPEVHEGEAGNVEPAVTQTAPATDTQPQEPATSAPATESPSDGAKEYTEVEVQDLAGKVARTVGPEVVKGKIAELGAARIAELTPAQRNALGAFLISKLP